MMPASDTEPPRAPEQQRTYPVPPFVSDFRDDIHRLPPNELARRNPHFDRMDVRDQERSWDWLDEQERIRRKAYQWRFR
jgi:hypothetical protein